MKNLVGVVQARMGSQRLPGKVLHRLAGRTVLDWVVSAAHSAEVLDDLVVATTTEASDDPVVAECRELGVDVYRGPVDDVLSRFVGAIADRGAGGVARFTADCPLLDPAIIAAVAGAWTAVPWLDYVSTALPRSVPRGMDVEIVRADVLREVATVATGYHRTHVTSAVYTAPDRYRLLGLTFQPDTSDLRLTLDTADDLALLTAVVAAFDGQRPSLAEAAAYLRANPGVAALNRHVPQKRLEAG
jgi:spore coat polysaccharide biosynthesis protein SpsF